MKVKHWQGYGVIEMKKINQYVNGNIKTIVVKVTGNHEYGLRRNDTYDIFYWICKRLGKDCKDYRNIISMNLSTDYAEEVDNCTYTISYTI